MNIQLDPAIEHMKEHGGVFLDQDESNTGCRIGMLCRLICYYSSWY